ncbi:MAG TPA: DUF2652 domain-containing protein [bacterium]|nr:DUF2652 domain-containing protein [bacterium]
MKSKEEKVVLIIADISGYTHFMITNKTTLIHSQVIITELIKTIIKQVKIPLKVSKLEGDAVFTYAVREEDEPSWKYAKNQIGEKLIKFFDMFSEKILELSESNICDCNACNNIDKLKIKIIVHSGEALLYQIDKFYELSGVDVIIVHRLLKNSVQSNQYILITESAYNEIEFPGEFKVINGEERYDDIGRINICIYFPPDEEKYFAEIKKKQNYSSAFFKMKNAMLKMFHSMLIKTGFKKLPQFNNLPNRQKI